MAKDIEERLAKLSPAEEVHDNGLRCLCYVRVIFFPACTWFGGTIFPVYRHRGCDHSWHHPLVSNRQTAVEHIHNALLLGAKAGGFDVRSGGLGLH